MARHDMAVHCTARQDKSQGKVSSKERGRKKFDSMRKEKWWMLFFFFFIESNFSFFSSQWFLFDQLKRPEKIETTVPPENITHNILQNVSQTNLDN
jgi:hypothetical protein